MAKVWAAVFEDLGLEGGQPSSQGTVLCVCENPDHDDNTPSMLVNLIKQNFYCFSCETWGDLDKLVSWTGGKVTGKYQSFETFKKRDDREWKTLLKNPMAFDDTYLTGRGVKDWQIDKWGIRSNDKMVIFPLKDRFGVITGVKARVKKAEGRSKYLTFGTMPDYIKTGFSIHGDWREKVVVTEGLFGLLKLESMGYEAITCLSASRASGLQKIMQVSNADFYIAFDPDLAGYVAASKLLFLLRSEENVYAYEKFFDIDDIRNEEDMPSWSDTIGSDWYDYFLEEIIERDYGEETWRKQKASFVRWAAYN